MENQLPQGRTSTLQYPIVDPVANAPMKAIPLQNIVGHFNWLLIKQSSAT